jgi:hypothetical protein
MGVQIINRRILTATTEVDVADLQQFINGLQPGQKVQVEIMKGYHDPRPGEGQPDSVTLSIDNPRVVGSYHPPGYRDRVSQSAQFGDH